MVMFNCTVLDCSFRAYLVQKLKIVYFLPWYMTFAVKKVYLKSQKVLKSQMFLLYIKNYKRNEKQFIRLQK